MGWARGSPGRLLKANGTDPTAPTMIHRTQVGRPSTGRHLQGPDTRIVRLWRSIASVSPVPSATLPRSMAKVRHVGACRITGKKTNNHAQRARAHSESNFLVCHGD